MSEAIRVVATMLVDPARGRIKGQRFQHDRVVGDPIEWVRVMAQTREVDELVVFDITRGPVDFGLIERIASECFVPLAYGGGIHDLATALAVVKCGADKVVLNPRSGPFWRDLADRIGLQSVVACIDDPLEEGESVIPAIAFGEVILQSKEHDGMMRGYDLALLRFLRPLVDVPIVVSSGAGSVQHCVEAVMLGADAVAAGAMYQFLEVTPNDVRRALADAGYPVRMTAVRA